VAIAVVEKKCLGCALCVLICPREAMRMPPSFIVDIDEKRCNDCRECLGFCPVDALKEA